MAKTMRAAVFTEVGKVVIQEMPIPTPGPGEVLVRQHACALCTVEQRIFKGIIEFPFPSSFGHEVSGVIEAIGPDTKTLLKPGDHVVLGASEFCGECHNCIKGIEGKCLQKRSMPQSNGIFGIFGMAEYAVTQSKRVFKVSPDIPFEETALAEPIACVLHSARKLDLQYGDTVVVIGAGTMGMLNVLVSNLRGAKVIVSEISESRRAKALEMGAFAVINPLDKVSVLDQLLPLNDGRKADAVIVAIGNDAANKDALNIVADNGKVMLFASAHPGVPLTLDPNPIHSRGIWITGVTGKNQIDLSDAAALLSSGQIKTTPLIEKKYPLENSQEAFEFASNNETYRVVLTM